MNLKSINEETLRLSLDRIEASRVHSGLSSDGKFERKQSPDSPGLDCDERGKDQKDLVSCYLDARLSWRLSHCSHRHLGKFTKPVHMRRRSATCVLDPCLRLRPSYYIPKLTISRLQPSLQQPLCLKLKFRLLLPLLQALRLS